LPEVEEPVRVVAMQEDDEEGRVEVVFAQVVVWVGATVTKVDEIAVFPGTT
jgi:hypothetical protein